MLLVSKVPRALEKKTKLFGFDLSDLMIIAVYLSISNLVFGQTKLKFLVVWCGTLLIAGVLYFIKKKHPENYIQHYGEYMRSPSVFSASVPDTLFQSYSFESEDK